MGINADGGIIMAMIDGSKPRSLDYRTPPRKQIKIPETPEERLWRHRRVLFRVSVIIILAPVIIHFAANLIMFGMLTSLSPADFASKVQPLSIATVRAMKEYQRDTGHLPNQMDDLIPKYLESYASGWQIVANGEFMQIGGMNQMINYDFTPGSEGWNVSGPFANGPIPLPLVKIGPSTRPFPALK
jgi:hypothetical protein